MIPCAEGVCVAAGVPGLEKSAEIIDALHRAGMRHIAFKPGSIAAIRLVCQIAAAHPDTNVLLQWTGGRAGGHHSFEDFHEPILQTYPLIRSQRNIVLIGGSGFGDAEHSWPYLNGNPSPILFKYFYNHIFNN
jgi:fatty acid synthase subunit beta